MGILVDLRHWHGKILVPPPVLTGTNSTNSTNSGAEGVKRKYSPHQSLVPPTLILNTRCTNIVDTVAVMTYNNKSTNLFLLLVLLLFPYPIIIKIYKCDPLYYYGALINYIISNHYLD